MWTNGEFKHFHSGEQSRREKNTVPADAKYALTPLSLVALPGKVIAEALIP